MWEFDTCDKCRVISNGIMVQIEDIVWGCDAEDAGYIPDIYGNGRHVYIDVGV